MEKHHEWPSNPVQPNSIPTHTSPPRLNLRHFFGGLASRATLLFLPRLPMCSRSPDQWTWDHRSII
jgi:hypothetical protein